MTFCRLLLTTALVALWLQCPTSVHGSIELSALISMQTSAATLEPNEIYTVSQPFALKTYLWLYGGMTTSMLPNKAKLVCTSTCFEIGQWTLGLSNLTVEFGTATNSSASLINVPAYNASLGVNGAALALMHTDVSSSLDNKALVSHDRTARMVSLQLANSNINVSSVFQIVGNTGSLVSGVALNLTAMQISTSSISCRSTAVDCVGLGDFHGSEIVIRSSRFGFVGGFVPGVQPRTVPLIRVNASASDQGRPTVVVELTDVPAKEFFAFDNVKETVLRSVKLGVHAMLRVSRSPNVHASDLELGESSVYPAFRFIDVGNVTIVGITLTGGTGDFMPYCTMVPALGIGTTNTSDFMQVAHVTRLKVSGHFCPPSMEAGIVTIQRVDAVTIADSEFGNYSSARAVEIREPKSVNVTSVLFRNVSTSHSGTLRVKGRADFDTVVTVEQSTFRQVKNSDGSALDVNHASLTLRSVSFVNNTQASPSGNNPSCVWVDNLYPNAWTKNCDINFHNVNFIANSGNQIVVINVNVGADAPPHRKISLEDVTFVNNTPSRILCELNGATYHVIKGLNITKNTGTTALGFTQQFNVVGVMERVCICENEASISNSPISCNASMFSGNFVVAPVAAGRCAPPSLKPCMPGACQFGTSGTGMGTGMVVTTTGPTTQPPPTTATTSTTTTPPNITRGTTYIGTTQSRAFVPTDKLPRDTDPISEATSSTTVEIVTVESSGSVDESTTTTASAISANSTPTSPSPDSNTSTTSIILVPTSESASSLLDDTAVLGSIIGGIIGFVVLVILVILLAVMLTKRRRRANRADTPTDTPLQDQASTRAGTETPTSSNMTSNYGSVQSALPAHYGASGFSSLK